MRELAHDRPRRTFWTCRWPAGADKGFLYGYVLNDPINLVDQLGLWTFQMGFSGSYTSSFGGGVAGVGGFGFAIDGHGNITT